MSVRIPAYYSQFYASNSTLPIFAIVFSFTTKETGVYDVTIQTRFDLGFEPPPIVIPSAVPNASHYNQRGGQHGFEMIQSPR
jgi:hypothetical protein